MKHLHLPKTLLIAAIFLSLFSFLFVNVHAGLITPCASPTELVAPPSPATVEEDENSDRDLPLPDVTVIGRLIDLAERLAGN